ncbi:NAD(P)/FAD-dependent oxidoreductase [Halobaculum magnesiiphilum]|uniref:FAD-binding oxidoreductase n=1 Tax=Halobaculum magnesiiphilum TaxID=1017351 RepID=A0A8T8WIX7_9EURY|nr:FAD-dependent oxidoreductase [Halobaculum magnesiiphilum]QZP39777.1 FAD-binding oxidoreductase [Halobaculum magnesiiphilum]
MSRVNSYDVVVIGAGSIGCSTADHLADDNDVLVLEKGQLDESASANASAFISDWWYFLEGEYIPGVTEKIREYFHGLETTSDFEFHDQPFISLVDEGERDSPKTEKMRENAEKIPGITYFDAKELASMYPDVLNLDGFAGGIVDTEAGYVEPGSYLRAMKQRAEVKGAVFEFGTEVEEIETADGQIDHVTTTSGDEIHCDSVVVAAGTHTESLVSKFTNLPVRPFVICAAEVKGDPSFSGSVPTTSGRGTLIGPNTAGNLLVGDEYWIEDLDRIPQEFPEEAKEKIAGLLPQLFTGFDGELEYVEDGEHHCPEGITITPDQIPVIDEVGGVDELVVADGSRGAVSLAPVIAVAVQSLLTGSKTKFSMERFAVDRFDLENPEYDLPMITEPRS